jgi:nucleoside-diphosphate-sugar epimerase
VTRLSLVTGAGGFIGANLVRRLLHGGDRVLAVVNPSGDAWRLAELGEEIERVPVDLRDPEATRDLVRRRRPARVFHLAAHGAYSWQRDADAMIDVNVRATHALLDGFDGEAFVHAGSSSEYGAKDHPPREDEPLEPNSHYAVTKAAATHLCALAARDGDRHVVTLRLYSAYGPWEDPGRLVPALVAHGMRGELPPLVDPATVRDFVHVDDVCDAFLSAAGATDMARGSVLNVASGRETTLAELVEVAREVLGVRTEPVWGTMPARRWDAPTWVGDPSAARRVLGWEPAVSLRDGLRGTAAWLGSRSELHERYRVHGGGG